MMFRQGNRFQMSTNQAPVDNLTLCLSSLLRIACFRPELRSLPKIGVKIRKCLSYSLIAKSVHSKQRFHPPFSSGKGPEKRPPFPPHARSVSSARVLWFLRARDPDPPHARSVSLFMRLLPSCDPSAVPETRLIQYFYAVFMRIAPLFGDS